jgi:hypothetical protein
LLAVLDGPPLQVRGATMSTARQEKLLTEYRAANEARERRGRRPATAEDVDRVRDAMSQLREVVALLVAADCPKSAEAARRALSSVKGAARHVEHRARRALDEREARGCWHYDYSQFCTQCDPEDDYSQFCTQCDPEDD